MSSLISNLMTRRFLTYLFLLISLLIASPAARADEPQEERHVELKEVNVKRTREHYSKRNNPAVDFVRRVMDARSLTDPAKNNAYYQYGKYERTTFAALFHDMDSTGRFGFLQEYADTSALSGYPVVNLSVKESVSDVYHRRSPERTREVVRMSSSKGFDELFSYGEAMTTLLNDMLREVDLYNSGDITLLSNRFVSPLGSTATDFYKFYLTDTIADATSADSLVVLSFVPKNPAMFGFNGKLYVAKGDSTMFIRRVQMRLPAAANVNFVTALSLTQEYDRGPDGSRLKTLDDMQLEMYVPPQNFYARRLVVYNSHSYLPPADTTIFQNPRSVIELNDLQGVSYRPVEMPNGADRIDEMMTSMRRLPLYRITEQLMRVISGGYYRPGGKNGTIGFGPIVSLLSRNELEGYRARVGVVTYPSLSKRWFGRAYGAYGFRDHKLKYSAELEYSFIDKRRTSREFPVRSLRLTHTYDVDMLGQQFFTANADAFFFSIGSAKNDKLTYHRLTDLQFNFEFWSQFSITARLRHERQEATRYVPFTLGDGTSLSHYQQTGLRLELRYAPGERYMQTTSERIPVNSDAPVFRLMHTFAPKGILGTSYAVNKTEASIDKRFWFSSWGYLDAQLAGGHVWSQSAFPDLLLPNANVSWIIQPNTYALLRPLEFVNDSYASTELTYWANGALLNYIPLVKRLKLREVFCFRALWGHLSRRNDPAYNSNLLQFPEADATQRMTHTPYMEMSVGLENIFRILRVDYVWRLTYRDNPVGDRWGIRAAIHLTF